jgi:hypothetical protein
MLIKILKIICLPIVILPFIIIAYGFCLMTWGLTSFKNNFNFLWNEYWEGQ